MKTCTGILLATCMLATAHAGENETKHARASAEYFPVTNAPPGMTLPFSEAVRVGDMLYLSGEIGLGADGKLVAGGISAEAKQVMDNIGAKLERHGSSWDHVVQCTVALLDIKDWGAFNEVYRGYFKVRYPARMAYATTGLALGARAEVQCNATVGISAVDAPAAPTPAKRRD